MTKDPNDAPNPDPYFLRIRIRQKYGSYTDLESNRLRHTAANNLTYRYMLIRIPKNEKPQKNNSDSYHDLPITLEQVS